MANLDRIDSQLTQAHVHREIWQAVRDEIVRVNPTSDGGFLESYTRLYAESTMVLIRRMADTSDGSNSLWAIWEAVRRNPDCASRVEYIEIAAAHFELADSDIDRVRSESDRHFTESFGSGSSVDHDRIAGYQQRLREDSQVVSDFVDRRLAHLDPKTVKSFDLSVVHAALGRVGDSANDLHRLLDRTRVMYEMVAVPPGWRASLRALFPQLPGRR